MADSKLLFYRGFPLIRSGNTIFYGSAGDAFAAKLTIKDTKKIADAEVPDKIMVQLLPKNPADAEALDAAHLWLIDVLFG